MLDPISCDVPERILTHSLTTFRFARGSLIIFTGLIHRLIRLVEAWTTLTWLAAKFPNSVALPSRIYATGVSKSSAHGKDGFHAGKFSRTTRLMLGIESQAGGKTSVSHMDTSFLALTKRFCST